MGNVTLLMPVPKEYSTYTDMETIEKTEMFYRHMEEIYQNMDDMKPEYLSRADNLLKNKARISALNNLLNEKDIRVLCNYSNEFFFLKFLCRVAQLEETFKEPNVLQNIHSIWDVSSWVQKSIFLMRQFEFGKNPDNTLLLLMQQKKMSYIWLAELICAKWIVRKVFTGCCVVRYLFTNGLKREALLFLMFLEKQLPYSEKKIMSFSAELLEMREYTLAYTVLMKHQHPDEDTIELQRELSMMQ